MENWGYVPAVECWYSNFFFTAKHVFHAFKLMYLKILCVYYYVDDSFDLFSAVGLGSWCFHMTLKYEMQVSTDKQL